MTAMARALPPFQAFLDEHLAPVRAFLRGMVGPHDAEDCLQETFLAALRAYPRAEPRNLRAWVLTIARRKAIDHHRPRSREAKPVAGPDPPLHRRGGRGGGAAWAGAGGAPERGRRPDAGPARGGRLAADPRVSRPPRRGKTRAGGVLRGTPRSLRAAAGLAPQPSGLLPEGVAGDLTG